jgi:hypothetical protein
VDARAMIAADLEILIKAHQPDDDGNCRSCKAAGELTPYPCMGRLLCEHAATMLARRRDLGN